MHGDFVWGPRKISDLVHGNHLEVDSQGRYYLEDGFSWFEMRCKALDRGDPLMSLDAIQLESSIDQISDLPVKAALLLAMHGMDPLQIASVLHDRKKRPVTVLLELGEEQVLKIERARKGSCR